VDNLLSLDVVPSSPLPRRERTKVRVIHALPH
jgi:hypothetical protein